MTRTERNQYPAALLKDRHSRSGMHHDSELERKQGYGANNWGSLDQQRQYEEQARGDAAAEDDEVAALPNIAGANAPTNGNVEAVSPSDSMTSFDSNTSGPTAATAPKDIKSAPGLGARRLSNVSDEEREKARVYREGVRASGGPSNLADIAKTSFGVSSPPNGNGFGTSPTKFKSGA